MRSWKRSSWRLTTLALVTALAAVACGGGEASNEDATAAGDTDNNETPAGDGAEPVNVKFAYVTTAPIATYVSAIGLEAFEQAGVDLEIVSVADVGQATEMALGGNAEVAHSAPTTALQAVAQGAPLKLIAGFEYTFTDRSGHEWEAGYLTALGDSGIESWADLEGKTVAVTALGSSYDYHVRDRLEEAGLDPDTDVNIVGVPYPQMLGALEAGEVDAALLLSVFYEQLAARNDVNVIATTSEITGNPLDMTAVIAAPTRWLEESPEEAVAFLRGLLVARQQMTEDIAENDGARLKEIAQEALDYSDDQLEVFYNRRLGYSGKDTEMINMLDLPNSVIESHIQTLANAGVITEEQRPTYDEAVDLSYLKQAYEDLGLTWDDSLEL